MKFHTEIESHECREKLSPLRGTHECYDKSYDFS